MPSPRPHCAGPRRPVSHGPVPSPGLGLSRSGQSLPRSDPSLSCSAVRALPSQPRPGSAPSSPRAAVSRCRAQTPRPRCSAPTPPPRGRRAQAAVRLARTPQPLGRAAQVLWLRWAGRPLPENGPQLLEELVHLQVKVLQAPLLPDLQQPRPLVAGTARYGFEGQHRLGGRSGSGARCACPARGRPGPCQPHSCLCPERHPAAPSAPRQRNSFILLEAWACGLIASWEKLSLDQARKPGAGVRAGGLQKRRMGTLCHDCARPAGCWMWRAGQGLDRGPSGAGGVVSTSLLPGGGRQQDGWGPLSDRETQGPALLSSPFYKDQSRKQWAAMSPTDLRAFCPLFPDHRLGAGNAHVSRQGCRPVRAFRALRGLQRPNCGWHPCGWHPVWLALLPQLWRSECPGLEQATPQAGK